MKMNIKLLQVALLSSSVPQKLTFCVLAARPTVPVDTALRNNSNRPRRHPQTSRASGDREAVVSQTQRYRTTEPGVTATHAG